MPRKAQTVARRGPGRPKRTPNPQPAAVVNTTPAKRGRPAKRSAPETAPEPPKKRGRPAKANPVIVETPAPKKRIGRPPKEQTTVTAAPVVTKRRGRPRKEEGNTHKAQTQADAQTAPRRGRPPRATTGSLNLNRVAGPSRVTKRAAAGSKATKPATATRINPRVRSTLRRRLPPAQKVQTQIEVRKPAKRGRPARAAIETSTNRQKPGRKASKPKALPKVAKPAAPRKRRGYTRLDVPDKILAQVELYIQELLDISATETQSSEGRQAGEGFILISPSPNNEDEAEAEQRTEQDQTQQDVIPELEVKSHEHVREEPVELPRDFEVELQVDAIVETEPNQGGDDAFFHTEEVEAEEQFVSGEASSNPQAFFLQEDEVVVHESFMSSVAPVLEPAAPVI